MPMNTISHNTTEALAGSRWKKAIEKPTVSERIVDVVIDELNCVSKW